MENQRMKYDIFISYESTTGESFANHSKIALERRKGQKHKVFLANETLAAGDKFGNKIESALNECKYFIAVITSLTMDSDWVMREYKRAVGMNKRIIPCRYSKISISDTGDFAHIQQIDFSDKSDLANKVIIEIRKIEDIEKKGVGIEKDAEEFLKRGNLLYSLGKFEDAEKEYKSALRINPSLADAYYNLDALQYNLKIRSKKETKNSKQISEKTQKEGEIFKFYIDEEKILKELVELYCIVKDFLIYAEEIDMESTFIPSRFELNHALDHLMRVFAVKASIKETENERGYYLANLSAGSAHIYRAGFDIMDHITILLRGKIVDDLKDFSPETIQKILPEYYTNIRPHIEDIGGKIAQLRISRDISKDTSTLYGSLMDYASLTKELEDNYETIIRKKPSLIEYEKRKRSGFLKKIFK
jgi:tetratricopeptide (TPR) repeat protein